MLIPLVIELIVKLAHREGVWRSRRSNQTHLSMVNSVIEIWTEHLSLNVTQGHPQYDFLLVSYYAYLVSCPRCSQNIGRKSRIFSYRSCTYLHLTSLQNFDTMFNLRKLEWWATRRWKSYHKFSVLTQITYVTDA